MPATTEGALVVLPSGEAVARTAPLEELAHATSRIAEMRGELTAAEAVLNDELIARLDRRGLWTQRTEIVGDVQWEISAPSPTAGTTGYDLDVLAAELDDLVRAGHIEAALAGEALVRKVTVVFRLEDEAGVRRVLKAAELDDRVEKVEPARSASASAIARVEKISGACEEAIGRARIRKEPPPRKAKVKAKTKASR